MAWHPAAKLGALGAGEVIAVTVAGVELVLGRDGERYFATQLRCPHRRSELSDGIVSRGHLICPMHGYRFSTETGRHDTASEYCLVMYEVRVSGDQIEIDTTPRSRT
jgi:nitrite reductase/ring-hydroxylating ferredoxin subunit